MSAASVVEAVAFEQLDAGVTLASVYQDVPDNTAPPVVILGDLNAVPFTADPADPDRRITLAVTTVTEADELAPCVAIQDEIEAALGGYRIDRAGWQLAFRSLGSAAALVEDASGYVGTTTFEIIAFSLD